MPSSAAEEWITRFELSRHPEGGWYRRSYESSRRIPAGALSEIDGERPWSTAIHYLLEGEDMSAFHRIQADEVWHFYTGEPLDLHVIEPDGKHWSQRLGDGTMFQAAVPGGAWMAAAVSKREGYALLGCQVAPGFVFAEFELAERAQLIDSYPQHRAIIERFTRD